MFNEPPLFGLWKMAVDELNFILKKQRAEREGPLLRSQRKGLKQKHAAEFQEAVERCDYAHKRYLESRT